ncbi:MAG: Asp-tRNA(Asn)/Glu-tRNA(Gln) amidotransferase subunit GatA [Planctomycetota bacterium]
MTDDAAPPGSARAIAAGVRAGRLDPVALTEAALARLRACNGSLNAYLDEDAEHALARAREIGGIVAAGHDPGRLAGVPVSVKDNIAMTGRTLTAGSRILEGYRAPYSGRVAERLLAEGAIPVGRTNLDEFAMGASTENSAYGTSRNPWDTTRVPGGSSGGSAAAVAAGVVPVALGSETGGSIRQPAALTGVTGFKPTYGAVSRHGLVAFGSSLDVIGPLAAHAADAALVYDVIAGHDPRDSTTHPGPRALGMDAIAAAPTPAGLKIAVPEEFLDTSVDEGVRARIEESLDLLARHGAKVTRLGHGSLPTMHLAIPVYYIVASSEASSNLARFDGVRYGPRIAGSDLLETYSRTRGQRFGPEVRRRIVLGTFALSAGYADAWYKQALSVRRLIQRELLALLEDYDLIAGPISPFPAFPIGSRAADPYQMYLCDLFTAPICLAGLPSVSVPCGLTAPGGARGDRPALPVGLQLTGRLGEDHRVLAAAAAFESVRGEPERCALYGSHA